MISKILTVILAMSISHVYAAVLAQDSPERKQLIAMGYELVKEDAGDTFTMADMGSTRIVFSKNEERLAISRFFNRQRKLNQSEEAELFQIINKFNETYGYQFSIGNQTLTATLYLYGNHDAKTFAKVVRMMDRVNLIFDTEPKFFQLVNNK
jgi:hypothetical protein